jgi:hypothetical protein
MKREGERRDVFERYIGEISKACAYLTEVDARELYDALQRQAQRRTAVADATLDEEGKFVKPSGPSRLDGDDGVIILDRGGPTGPDDDPGDSASPPPASQPEAGPKKKRKKKRPSPPAGGGAEPKPGKPKRKGDASGPGLFSEEGGAGDQPPALRKKKKKRRTIAHAS